MNNSITKLMLLLLLALTSVITFAETCSVPIHSRIDMRWVMGVDVYEGTLDMDGCSGQFVVSYFDSETNRTETIIQSMKSRDTKHGLFIMGFNPIDGRTKRPDSSYSPDNFLFRRNVDGSWKITNCDRQENCASVKIVAVRKHQNNSSANEEEIDTDILVRIIKKYPSGYALIDARDEANYNDGHIPTAISIPFSRFYSKMYRLPKNKDKILIFYCWHETCGLSTKSAQAARQAGYKKVFTYTNGIRGWKAAGYKLVRN